MGGAGSGFTAAIFCRNITVIAVYNHNAGIYGQNKHACVNLRRILGLGQVARVFWGLTQPPKLRAAAGLPCSDFGLKNVKDQILASKRD